jgi:multidrug resistance protein
MTRRPLPTGFGSLWTAVAVDVIGFGIVIPILPLYADRFDISPPVIGLLLASFSLAQFVAAPLWGRISDAVGRKPALVTSLVGTALGSLLTAFAPSITVLFLGRIIDGASGASLSVAQAATSDLAPPSERPRLLGLLGAAFGLGFVIGPAIGGLSALAGPRVPFVVAAVLAGANAAVAARRLPETRRRAATDARSPTRSPRPARLATMLAVGFLSTAGFGAFESTFALFGARRLGLTMTTTSFVFVAAGLLIAFANVRLIEPVVGRLGVDGALRAGLALDAVGLLVLTGTETVLTLAAAIALLAIGQGLVTPSLAAAVAARVAPEHRGLALGNQQAAASLARVAGPVLAGAAFGAVGPGAPFAAAAVLMLAAAFITRTSGNRRKALPDAMTAEPRTARRAVAR